MYWDLRDKLLTSINVLLALLAAFTIALTLYSCSKFYTFLPTSDTWTYTDFLAQAAQGHLDTQTLFVKHNDAHVIVLPKLAYFFDVWLLKGSGVLVMFVSLAAMLSTTAIFLRVIFCINAISKTEKTFLACLSIILLMSACQVESLLNPANLQWSLLVFSATLTAWFVSLAAQKKSPANIAGVIAGIILASLTSASPLLIVLPFALLALGKKWATRVSLALAVVAIASLVIGQLFFHQQFPFLFALVKNWLKFTVDFLAPPVERLDSLFASIVAGALVLCGLFALAYTPLRAEKKEAVFFGFLLWFSLGVILAAGIVRAYSPDAFTFRFVNLGLLFAAALLPLLLLQQALLQHRHRIVMSACVVYVMLLSYVNVTEASAFAYGRNHIRLTQVAHALDINDPFVVASMPGTVWEKSDFDFIQANKYKLKEAHIGIYASAQYQQLGKPIAALENRKPLACKTSIIKMRRLLPDQASWRLWGETKTEAGETLSHAWFVDNNNIIRGFAIPIEPTKNLLADLGSDKQWAGFLNLDTISLDGTTLAAGGDETSLTLYAYSDSDKKICQGEKIVLPEYKDLRKKSARAE